MVLNTSVRMADVYKSQVLYHCNYISSFYCYTDGSSLWFSTCPSGDSYDRIKSLDLSTGGITTLFDGNTA